MSRSCDCDFDTENNWCPRHKMVKGARMRELCRTRDDYRSLWDHQAMFGNPTGAPAPTPAGVGTELKRILERFGILQDVNCGCRAVMEEMNRNGPQWCKKHSSQIARWMVSQAEKRKVMRYLVRFSRKGATKAAERLVYLAIRIAEKKEVE